MERKLRSICLTDPHSTCRFLRGRAMAKRFGCVVRGEPGFGGGPSGDALIEIKVRPHRFFTRDGNDIRLELPITLGEAVLGGKVRVPTPSGPIDLMLPPNSSSGKVLRIKGKGVPRANAGAGDIYVTLKIVLPDRADEDLASFVKRWTPGTTQNPRKSMEG